MSRLRKKYAMDMNAFQGTINQTSQKGRQILKSLEDFKFTLEQTARLLNNNQQLSQGMIQKRKSIDEISNKLYQIVFDIENMDISNAFMVQNQPVMEELPNKSPAGPQEPGQNNPGQIPGQPQVPGQPDSQAPSTNPGAPTPGGAPGGAPSGVSDAPVPGKPGEDAKPEVENSDEPEENNNDESDE